MLVKDYLLRVLLLVLLATSSLFSVGDDRFRMAPHTDEPHVSEIYLNGTYTDAYTLTGIRSDGGHLVVTSGFVEPETTSSSVTYTVTFSDRFNVSSFQVGEFTNLSTGDNYLFTPDVGTPLTLANNDSNLTGSVATLTPTDWVGVSSITVSYTGSDDWRVGLDNIYVSLSRNINSTLSTGLTVDESSMISLPSTANTIGEKVNLFDFTIRDMGTSDGLSTDITQVVIHTSGTADFSKVQWLLNGLDANDVVGTYSSDTNTTTFSALSISVADDTNETYILSGYFLNPTGLVDNSSFEFSIDGDTDITTDSSKSGMASTQDAVTNNTNAKVDVTATKLIFKTHPSSGGVI